MKTIYAVVILFCIMCSNDEVSAQSQTVADKNLVWNSVSSIEKSSGQGGNEVFKIITNGGKSIDLIHGDQVLNFTIQSITGVWEDENIDGILIYSVIYQGDKAGKIIAKRNNSKASIEIDFSQIEGGMHYEFFISTITKN
jgi:hypothetical protein